MCERNLFYHALKFTTNSIILTFFLRERRVNDAKKINAFALPGGQIFITEALFKLLTTEGQLVSLKYSRSDELEADKLGVRFMSDAGYDPRAMIEVMQILAQASQGNQPPEFLSTHPNPDNRIPKIQAAIDEKYPNGIPSGLTK
ncbi:MAG: hypothetical protein EXR62_15870 [Chloroflexi bacterium]|nr:hypothetical protein [Chloroflexota bacterium]